MLPVHQDSRPNIVGIANPVFSKEPRTLQLEITVPDFYMKQANKQFRSISNGIVSICVSTLSGIIPLMRHEENPRIFLQNDRAHSSQQKGARIIGNCIDDFFKDLHVEVKKSRFSDKKFTVTLANAEESANAEKSDVIKYLYEIVQNDPAAIRPGNLPEAISNESGFVAHLNEFFSEKFPRTQVAMGNSTPQRSAS